MLRSRPPRRPEQDHELPHAKHAFRLLEQIATNPDATQADLAARLGVAIGTVNWYVKRLTAKGLVKVTHLQRRRVRYLITPKGIAEKARLAYKYVQVSMHMYKVTRLRARELLGEARQAGFNRVWIEGDGDLVDVCRLTCLEAGVEVVASSVEDVPGLIVSGAALSLQMPAALTLALALERDERLDEAGRTAD